MVKRVSYEDVRDEDYVQVMDLNARSVLVACKAVIPHMKANGGFIINTTSIAAQWGRGWALWIVEIFRIQRHTRHGQRTDRLWHSGQRRRLRALSRHHFMTSIAHRRRWMRQKTRFRRAVLALPKITSEPISFSPQRRYQAMCKRQRAAGRSNAMILTTTFSDALAAYTVGQAKVFGVSIKDRGAVSMA
jgi:NAD(P)-dependent dehydrogenase (short-subunit alcohol dehydrogenase family)